MHKPSLTYRDLQVFQYHEVEGMTAQQTAEQLEISRKTVQRTKTKASYHELAQAALQEKGMTVQEYARKLIEKLDAKKGVNYGGERIEEDDNVAQVAALKEVAGIYGVHAPKEIDLKHSLASASDEEVDKNLADAAQRLGVESVARDSGDDEAKEAGGGTLVGDVL